MEMAHLGLCGSVPKYLRLEWTSESDSESELFFKIFADARRWILELIPDTGRLMALAVTFLDVLLPLVIENFRRISILILGASASLAVQF